MTRQYDPLASDDPPKLCINNAMDAIDEWLRTDDGSAESREVMSEAHYWVLMSIAESLYSIKQNVGAAGQYLSGLPRRNQTVKTNLHGVPESRSKDES